MRIAQLRTTLAQFLPRLVRRLRGRPRVWVDADVLKGRLDDDEQLSVIDVRGPEEFTGPLGHIPNSRNVPLGEFLDRIEELRPLGKRPIVVVCKTDKRSANAAKFLRETGFRDVAVLRGGLEHWNELGFDTSGVSAKSEQQSQ